MSYHRRKIAVAIFAAAAVAGACADSTGSRGMGTVEVTMQQVSAPMAQLAEVFLSPTGATARVEKEKVDSLFVWFSRIGFLPVDSMAADSSDSTSADSTDSGDDDVYPWIWMDLDSVVRIDLMALPGEADSVVVIAAGSVPAGTYHKLRMIVADADIYFNDEIPVGNRVYDPDTKYTVDIPSGAQSGLKTRTWFTVDADADTGDPLGVNVLFDPNMTFNNVTATGSGRVKITPVLKTR